MGDIANTIFNKVLVKMLSKYLAYYMNNFSKESFKLQVIKGTFALEDIEINCQFLKDTVVLPNLEITECLCDKIFLTVPWGHITTESIVFDLDKITMTLTEIPIGAKGDSKPKKVKPSSYGWMQRTVDGIKMNIKEIDMTAKLNGYRGNPFVGHILCKGISIYSTDANWKPVDLKEAFVADKQKSEIVFFKVLDCENLTVSFADAQNEPLEFCTMMRDAAVQIRCKVAKDAKDGHVICGEFHLVMQDCELSYSDSQWKGFLELAKGLVGCFTRTDQEYVHYRDVGKTGEELEKGGRPKIPPEKSSSWWERRKQAKEQERMECEKAKRLYEMELRAKERQELESIGADTTHLEVMEETTFNIQIDKGVLNMLDEENRLSNEPGKHAFARLFFEDMKIVIGLPPAMDVPDSNKWTANTRNRLLLDAYLQLGNFALQIQEPLHGAGDDAAGSSSGQKRLVMLTDGRSESLKRRVKKQRRKKEKGKKKGNGKRRSQKKQKPFCHVGWTVRSNTPEETNMADWLKSLECKMAISVYQSHLILLHRWWARIIRYLETSSVGSDEVQAMALMKVVATLDVTDNVIMLPLAGCDKLEVLTQEEIEALPHVTLYCTKLKGGKAVIESGVAKRLAATRIPARFVPDIIQGNGKGKGKEVDVRPSTSKKVSKHILHVEGMGAGEDGWLTQKLMRKPQRFQFLLQNMILNIGKDQILSPVDYNLELTLHRYLSTEQLLLEMTSHVEAVQLHINRAQYLLFAHFLNYLSTVVWPELEMVVLRKYGPSHIQRSLNEMSYTELAKKIGYMPMSVNTHTAIDYLLLHINGNELPQDLVNSIFKLDTKERDLSIVEMHVEDLATHSTNTTIVKSDVYQKDASVRRITLFAPPGRPQQKETDDKGKEQGKPTSGDRNGPTLKVETLTGDVLSDHFSDMQELLVERNVDTLSRLLAKDEKGLSTKGLPPQLHVAAVDLLVDNSRASQVPPEVATFLKDFATLNNSC